jgi:hypothetical protein
MAGSLTQAALNAAFAHHSGRTRRHNRTAEVDPNRKFDLTPLGAKTSHSPATHVWMAPALQEIMLRVEQMSLAVMCPACWCSPGGLLALMGIREPRPHHSSGIDVPMSGQASLDCVGSTDCAITLHCLSQALARSSAVYAAAAIRW